MKVPAFLIGAGLLMASAPAHSLVLNATFEASDLEVLSGPFDQVNGSFNVEFADPFDPFVDEAIGTVTSLNVTLSSSTSNDTFNYVDAESIYFPPSGFLPGLEVATSCEFGICGLVFAPDFSGNLEISFYLVLAGLTESVQSVEVFEYFVKADDYGGAEDGEGYYDSFVSSQSAVITPLPAAAWMMLAGLGALGGAYRLKTRRAHAPA